MGIQWRATLVQMQSVLRAGTLPLSASAEGYALLQELTSHGTIYDAFADDGASNASAFSATVAAYVGQAAPVFLDLDRVCRYIFSEYLASPSMTPAIALAFGVITQTQADNWQLYLEAIASGTLPPAGALAPPLSAATALAFDRLYSTATQQALGDRNNGASVLAEGTPDAVNLNATSAAWFSGVWYDTDETSYPNTSPPTNPSPSAEMSSAFVTTLLTTQIAACQAWLAATSFT